MPILLRHTLRFGTSEPPYCLSNNTGKPREPRVLKSGTLKFESRFSLATWSKVSLFCASVYSSVEYALDRTKHGDC
jgi:hypothetical protein